METSRRMAGQKCAPPISRLILYVRDLPKVAAFYEKYFGLVPRGPVREGSVDLVSPQGGCALVLLPASKGHKIGQSCVKIVFDVPDVGACKDKCQKEGLDFGVIHRSEGYEFANARDPARNLIQISSREARRATTSRGRTSH
jgi:predicted enzyme related to lactoylglutathione lyase